MPRWDLFAGIALLLAVFMLGMARATQQTLSAPEFGIEGGEGDADLPRVFRSRDVPFDTRLLLANVALTHGLLGTFLVIAAWYSNIPRVALAVDGGLAAALVPGVLLGGALYAANEAAAYLADLSRIEHDERLRELLAPESARGWAVLLLAVLPLIAGVEELLFRGALIGVFAAGYGLPVWGLAAVSSVLFGLGHGLQGPAGVLVTGALGFVLAAAYVMTGSLWVVIVAHYLINALEFTIHEGIGVEL